MKNNQVNMVRKIENKIEDNKTIVIDYYVSDPTEGLYAVVTPVKMR